MGCSLFLLKYYWVVKYSLWESCKSNNAAFEKLAFKYGSWFNFYSAVLWILRELWFRVIYGTFKIGFVLGLVFTLLEIFNGLSCCIYLSKNPLFLWKLFLNYFTSYGYLGLLIPGSFKIYSACLGDIPKGKFEIFS